MDDKGKLNIYENRIRFVGEKYEFSIKNIKKIFLTTQIPNYGAHFISGAISFIVIWYTFLIYFSSVKYFLTLSLILIFLYPVSLFLTRSDWIGLEYRTRGKTKKAYFTDGFFPEGSPLRKRNEEKKSESLYEKFLFLKIDIND